MILKFGTAKIVNDIGKTKNDYIFANNESSDCHRAKYSSIRQSVEKRVSLLSLPGRNIDQPEFDSGHRGFNSYGCTYTIYIGIVIYIPIRQF